MGFKMIPGSRDHGLKTGQGMAERGLISGGPKAYPLANNDPNSKPIEPWEVDVDLGGGTLDRQTPITDVVQDPLDVVSKEDAKSSEEYRGYEGDSPVSDYKPEAEIGRFSRALQKANTNPESGAQTSAYNRADDFMKDRGRTLSVMGGASTVEGNDYNYNTMSSDNDYYKGLEDVPVSAQIGRTSSGNNQRAHQMNQITGNISENMLSRLTPKDPAYNANSSSMFSINKNRNTSRVATGNIKSAEEVASDLKRQGTLDPTYLDKLDAYKKNAKIKGDIY